MSADYKRYLFEYRHDGAEWALEVVAASPQDAEARIRALAWARYRGEIQANVPLPSFGVFGRILHWLKVGSSHMFGNPV